MNTMAGASKSTPRTRLVDRYVTLAREAAALRLRVRLLEAKNARLERECAELKKQAHK